MITSLTVLSLFQRVLVLGLIAGSISLVGLVVYRLAFHPLAKYPGPFLARITNLYAAYHSWKGDLHIDMWRCHEKYGDHVRYAPNGLLVNNATGLQDIYSHGKAFKKSQKYAAMVHQVPNTLTAVDKKKHGKKRRVISQGFSDAALKGHEDVVIQQIQQLCNQLRMTEDGKTVPAGEWAPARNMAKWSDYFTFDVMSNIIFGVPWSTLRSPTYRFVPEVIEKSNVRIGTISQAPELMLFRLDKYLFPAAIAARDRFILFIGEMIAEGIKVAKQSHKGVFALLTNAKDPETGLPLKMKELAGESATLIVAGTDTSSTALAACFFYLCHHPDAYNRAAAEIRSTFENPEDIHMGPKMAQCKYLRACIDEAMRMSPSAASALWREAEGKGAMVDGQFIPGGVDVGTCIYSIHHNPEYYPQPFSYIPERWLKDDTSPVRGQGNPSAAFNPFSIGPRSCIGKSLAYVELHLTLAHVLLAFDFRLAVGEPREVGEGKENAEYGRHRVNEFQLYDHLTCAKNGPFVEFCPRIMA